MRWLIAKNTNLFIIPFSLKSSVDRSERTDVLTAASPESSGKNNLSLAVFRPQSLAQGYIIDFCFHGPASLISPASCKLFCDCIHLVVQSMFDLLSGHFLALAHWMHAGHHQQRPVHRAQGLRWGHLRGQLASLLQRVNQ